MAETHAFRQGLTSLLPIGDDLREAALRIAGRKLPIDLAKREGERVLAIIDRRCDVGGDAEERCSRAFGPELLAGQRIGIEHRCDLLQLVDDLNRDRAG